MHGRYRAGRARGCREDCALQCGRDHAEQRRTKHQPGDHLAHHLRLAQAPEREPDAPAGREDEGELQKSSPAIPTFRSSYDLSKSKETCPSSRDGLWTYGRSHTTATDSELP